MVSPAAAPAPPAGAGGGERDGGARALLDTYRKEMGKSAIGVIPVQVTVPSLGPSIFVAAELTAESHAPVLDIKYVRTDK
jgi:hypothetical protein